MTWQPIETAPKASLSMNEVVIAKFWQSIDENGDPDGPLEISWAQVAYPTYSGWQLGTHGVRGAHGFASFSLCDATHWMPLPEAPA